MFSIIKDDTIRRATWCFFSVFKCLCTFFGPCHLFHVISGGLIRENKQKNQEISSYLTFYAMCFKNLKI